MGAILAGLVVILFVGGTLFCILIAAVCQFANAGSGEEEW